MSHWTSASRAVRQRRWEAENVVWAVADLDQRGPSPRCFKSPDGLACLVSGFASFFYWAFQIRNDSQLGFVTFFAHRHAGVWQVPHPGGLGSAQPDEAPCQVSFTRAGCATGVGPLSPWDKRVPGGRLSQDGSRLWAGKRPGSLPSSKLTLSQGALVGGWRPCYHGGLRWAPALPVA